MHIGDKVLFVLFDEKGKIISDRRCEILKIWGRSNELHLVCDSYDIMLDDGTIIEKVLSENIMRLN